MNKAVVIPTGSEIIDGTVLDTNSPIITYSIITMEPLCTVLRERPVCDDEEAIRRIVEYWAAADIDLIVLIGGSGGGDRFDSTLSADCTHTALENLLDEKVSREIWGKNGHLWCKLICGRKNGAIVINVPGPYIEAKAAIEAFCQAYTKHPDDLKEINAAMIQAVLAAYPENAEV